GRGRRALRQGAQRGDRGIDPRYPERLCATASAASAGSCRPRNRAL
ncbi:MAG: hypothetical protein AVDCRST_MAG53-1046, partial [uncultured Solirubrobacteraceae bacterium]